MEILKYQRGNSGMKVICLDHDEITSMSKNAVSGAIKHLHWQLFEMSVKPAAANVWAKCEKHSSLAREALFHVG